CPEVTLLPADGATIDALVVWDLDVALAVQAIEQHPTLQWVHLRWAGVPSEVLQALEGRDIPLTNGSGAHGVAMGEYVVGVVLAHYKRFHDMHAAQLRSEWIDGFGLRELRGQRVGIIGLGDLGGSIARVLRPFGVALRSLRRSGAPSADVDEVFATDRVDDFLDGLDVLVIAAPLTVETRGLIGANQLARLAPGAFLVNVGRAAIVDEAAMLAALRSGQLDGAALDVFLTEPLPADSPLWTEPNVYISPHCADASPQSLERGLALFVDNVERFARGEQLRNVVDRQAGY
ncbi:MAG TPA: D-2-hydroxyacid dehydrogenase, partial [Chloroflexota bacterium]